MLSRTGPAKSSPPTRGPTTTASNVPSTRIGIRHLWFVDLEARTLTVSKLVDGHWLEVGVYGEDDVIRAEPFEAIELRLGELWPPTRGP